jgi:hypothetical protein
MEPGARDEADQAGGSGGGRRRRWSDRGASIVEYAMGIAAMALIAVTALQFATQQTNAMFEMVLNDVEQPEVGDEPPTPPTTNPTTTITTTTTTTQPCRRRCR